jgi:hypothetical protein
MNKYYVYTLSDPRTNKIFYIGKGIYNRIYNHEFLVRNGKFDNNSAKCKLIKEIIDSGNKIIYNKPFANLSEEDAYTKEKELITLYGLSNLTNIMSGNSQIRKKLYKLLSNFFDILNNKNE